MRLSFDHKNPTGQRREGAQEHGNRCFSKRRSVCRCRGAMWTSTTRPARLNSAPTRKDALRQMDHSMFTTCLQTTDIFPGNNFILFSVRWRVEVGFSRNVPLSPWSQSLVLVHTFMKFPQFLINSLRRAWTFYSLYYR